LPGSHSPFGGDVPGGDAWGAPGYALATVPVRKLTVIGLDAATFDVIDPLLEAGDLPNIARILDEGTGGVLRSTTHPLTPHAWATMVTGVNVGRHGIWDFMERDETGYEFRLINGSYRRAPAIWDRLRRSGHRVGLVNIPFTWPAPEVDGFAIAGMDAAAREKGMTHPSALLDEMRSRLGSLELDHRFPVTKDGRADTDFVRRAAEQKVEATLWLADRFQPELLWVVFMAADHIHHVAWPDWEERGRDSAVAETYRILDEAVGRLADCAGGNDVLIVSDHGGGSLLGVVNLNAWLAKQGFLTYSGRTANLGRKAIDTLFELRRHIPEGLRYRVKQRAGGLRERAYGRKQYSVVDWPRTRAFSYGTFGNVVVNVRGRELHGTVEPGDEYESVRDEIAASALELTAPDGTPIVAAVHRREDLFHGPQLEKVPDLLIEFTDYAWLGKGNLKQISDSIWDTIELEPGSSHRYVGSHRHDGIFALAGPSATHAARTQARIEDVAPTMLYLLGENLPADLEGRLIAEAIDPELLDRRPPEYDDSADTAVAGATEGYSAEEAEEIESRLRGLGYVE
jgi:predicted AlkP superfamily phosphohydrolase/phosphomutase